MSLYLQIAQKKKSLEFYIVQLHAKKKDKIKTFSDKQSRDTMTSSALLKI